MGKNVVFPTLGLGGGLAQAVSASCVTAAGVSASSATAAGISAPAKLPAGTTTAGSILVNMLSGVCEHEVVPVVVGPLSSTHASPTRQEAGATTVGCGVLSVACTTVEM